MNALFSKVGLFLLDRVASTTIDKGSQSLADRLSKKALLNTDEIVREYLIKHLSEYEYEKIDLFLVKKGIYSHDQASANWSIMADQTDSIIEDFYHAHPDLQYDKQTLTPLLEQTIIAAYQSVISQLSIEGRVLYNQSLRNREQEKREHQQLKDELRNLSLQLSQATNKLTYYEVVKTYEILSASIHAGNYASSESLIKLMETQVDDRDRSYCTALKIYLYSFIGSSHDVEVFCVQYLRDNPPPDLTTAVVTFLLQMEQKNALRFLQSIITNLELSTLVNDYITDTSSNPIRSIIEDGGALKAEYENVEYALWVFAHHSRRSGNRTVASAAYSKLEQLHPSVWTHWCADAIKASLLYTDTMMNGCLDITNIRNQAKKMLEFSVLFDQLCDDLCSGYLETILSFSTLLPIEDFDRIYNKLSLRMKDTFIAQKYWYVAHLSEWEKFNENELISFCKETDNHALWSAFLCRKATDYPNFVIESIEKNPELLQKEFSAFIAYSDALSASKDISYSFDILSGLSIPSSLALPCNLHLYELCKKISNDSASKYLQIAVNEALNPSSAISIADLRALIHILTKENRWIDASNILEKYQGKDPAIMFLRLEVLIGHENQANICSALIENLELYYNENAFLIYCKGVLAERELVGSGMELFEKAFRLHSCPQYARATLVSRLRRNTYIDDDVLSYASGHNNIDLLHICGITHIKHGKAQKGYTALLQALINCSNLYHEGLYSSFIGERISHQDHNTPPDEINVGTCCVLSNRATEQTRKIWIHDESIALPTQGSCFAEYEHISPNAQTAFLLLGHHQGDTVLLSDGNYEIKAINYGDVIASKYCMQSLLDHGVLKQIQIDTDNLDSLFDELKRLSEPRSNHIHETIQKYRSPDPGLPIDIFAQATGKPYYKAVYALVHDSSIPFWSGTDSVPIDKDCILTPSVIAVLSSLNIHPPAKRTELLKFSITNALKTELELQSRAHRNDRTAAILGFEQDGHPYMVENTQESKRSLNQYFACLNEWANWAQVLTPVSPQDYPDELRSVADAIGIPNVEAITLAKRMNCLVCCDDLFLRKYMHFIGIVAPTAVDVLLYLDYPFQFVMDTIDKLLDRNYISPITPNFTRWVSHCVQNATNDDVLADYSLLIIDLIAKVLSVPTARDSFLNGYRQMLVQKEDIHPTLKTIIDISLSKHFYGKEAE